MTARPQKRLVRMVLSYAHRDRSRLDLSELVQFLEGLARTQKWDFWWDEKMEYPRFDEEIKERFENADAIICIVSQNFLNSDYIRSVESKTVRKRLKQEEILVLPVLLTESLWREDQKWLNNLEHFPKQGFLHGSGRKKWEIDLQITNFITSYFRKKVLPFRDPQLLYKLRRLPETSLKREQNRILTSDSCERAVKMVPDPKLRAMISREAKRLMKQKSLVYLPKDDLAAIDKKFLARGRKADPEAVRWVLRCAGLHPQGRTNA